MEYEKQLFSCVGELTQSLETLRNAIDKYEIYRKQKKYLTVDRDGIRND